MMTVTKYCPSRILSAPPRSGYFAANLGVWLRRKPKKSLVTLIATHEERCKKIERAT